MKGVNDLACEQEGVHRCSGTVESDGGGGTVDGHDGESG